MKIPAIPRRLPGLAALVAVVLAACGPADEPAPQETMGDTVTEAVPTMEMPDTTAEAVWAHLQQASYAENWSFWPDKQPYYQGIEPHGALLNTYLNDRASQWLAALRAGNPTSPAILPEGSIVVKENHLPDSSLASVTVMYKVAGYDAQHNDWWWMKRLADGTVEAAGRVAPCAQCHGQASTQDYLMTLMQQQGQPQRQQPR